MLKVEVMVQTADDLELLKPLVAPGRVVLQPPQQWPTRTLFEELQRRATAAGKQVHLVDVGGEGYTATQTGAGPAHTATLPGGEAQTTRQAEQTPRAANTGFTKEAQLLWEKYRAYHDEAPETVTGTTKTQKVSKTDMERWLEAHPQVLHAFADANAPAPAEPTPAPGGNGADAPPAAAEENTVPDQSTVIAWANALMQHSGFDGLREMFTRFGSTTGKLSGVPETQWPEMVTEIQRVTGITELPT